MIHRLKSGPATQIVVRRHQWRIHGLLKTDHTLTQPRLNSYIRRLLRFLASTTPVTALLPRHRDRMYARTCCQLHVIQRSYSSAKREDKTKNSLKRSATVDEYNIPSKFHDQKNCLFRLPPLTNVRSQCRILPARPPSSPTKVDSGTAAVEDAPFIIPSFCKLYLSY